MSNEPSLRTGTVIIHPEHGKGVIILNFTEDDIDMVEVHWQGLNIIIEHRVESLRRQLTGCDQSGKSLASPWLSLLEES